MTCLFYLGKRVMEAQLLHNGCMENIMTLLAACYLKLDGPHKWLEAVELLEYGGRNLKSIWLLVYLVNIMTYG